MGGTVAIVGSARTTREKAPWDDPNVQIWGINEALAFPWMRRADAMFQMHKRWSFTRPTNRNDPHHWEWLKQEHPFPIYMQQKWSDVPSAVEYPLNDVLATFRRRYFTSTVPYMIALALLQKVERIELYGVEMASNSEYFWQRDCVTYWLGRAESLGVDVYLPPGCSLLRGLLYGYDGAEVIERMQFEMRARALAEREAAARIQVAELTGRIKLLAEQDAPELDAALHDERQALVELATLQGARAENEHYIQECDALLRASGGAGETKEYSDE